MIIGIPDDYADFVRRLDCFEMLAGHETRIWNDAVRDEDELARRFRDVDALVLLRERTHLPGSLVRRLPKLRIIAMSGPHPNIDADACTQSGVLICVGHGAVSYATAELTWGLVISTLRRIPGQSNRLREGGWQTHLGTALHGRTLGVLGFGKIGRLVAGYGAAFGMRVLVWSREKGLADARAAGYETCMERRQLFERADVASLHIRYVPETRGIVTAADLSRMKPTAVLVNTSRSALIEDGALAAALAKGRPGAAGIDVYEEEPHPRDPLIGLENVVCTPHLGYFERDQMEAYFRGQFERVLAFAAGKPIDVENPAALRARSASR